MARTLLALLPKPDGIARAVYTGFIHPSSITDFALAAPLYFGELIVAHPQLRWGDPCEFGRTAGRR
jgi:hypothetical protein